MQPNHRAPGSAAPSLEKLRVAVEDNVDLGSHIHTHTQREKDWEGSFLKYCTLQTQQADHCGADTFTDH